MRPRFIAFLIVLVVAMLPTRQANATVGDLTRLPGTDACVSDTGSSAECVDGNKLVGAAHIAISPDGTSVYTTVDNGIAVFDRDTTAGSTYGRLTQKAGIDGCITDDGSTGFCTDGTALVGTWEIVVSPDGKSVYVASLSSDAVAIFDRDSSGTATNGKLTQKGSPAGCVSEDGTGGLCVIGKGLDLAKGVAVSPDGTSVYVASRNDSAVAVFDRATNGVLTQKVGIDGCASESGLTSTCSDDRGLTGASSVTVSPDGRHVYVGAEFNDGIAVFDRDSSGTGNNGKLTQKTATSGCIDMGNDGTCAAGTAIGTPIDVTASPDGKTVYLASYATNAVGVFSRDLSSGKLTQAPGTAACISETGTSGSCTDGKILTQPLSVAVSSDGKSVYVASSGSDGLAILVRDPSSGALSQSTGIDGCVSDVGLGPCTDGPPLDNATGVVISPNSRSVYTGASNSHSVDAFSRTSSSILCTSVSPTVMGTSAAETLLGTAGDDIMFGKGGADKLKGLGGSDVLCGGGGGDKLRGGDGDDYMDGENGTDNCDGGLGTDKAKHCETLSNIP